MSFGFGKVPRRHVREIPLAPVLDLLTVVVFFLILSTSFEELRQNEIPPAVMSKSEPNTAVEQEIPLNPKLLVGQMKQGQTTILLKWLGRQPGQVVKEVNTQDATYSQSAREVSQELVTKFLTQFPKEKSIQLGFTGKTQLQLMLSVIDGVTPATPDIALISHDETEALMQGSLQ